MKQTTIEVFVFFLLRFCSCYAYLFPSLLPYYVSYFRVYNPYISQTSLYPVLTFEMAGCFFSHFIIKQLTTQFGVKRTVLISAGSFVIISQFLFLSGFSSVFFLWAIHFVSGFVLNLGNICVFFFFQAKYGDSARLYFGKCLGGDLIGTFFWLQVATRVINPHNLKATDPTPASPDQLFPLSVYSRLPFFLTIFSLIYFFGMLAALQLVEDPPRLSSSDSGEQKAGGEGENYLEAALLAQEIELQPIKSTLNETKVISTPEPLNPQSAAIDPKPSCFSKPGEYESRQPRFLVFVTSCILLVTFNAYYMAAFKVMGLTKLNNDNLLSLIFSLGGLVNMGLRLFSGEFFDLLGFKKAHLACCFACLLICVGYLATDSSMPRLFNWIHLPFRGILGLIFLNIYNSIFALYEKEAALHLVRYVDLVYFIGYAMAIPANTFLVFGTNYFWVHLTMTGFVLAAIELFRRNLHLYANDS